MIEHDTRLEAKKLSEFITPQCLREFIAEKVKGNDLDVLDVSIGSGQLLFELNERIKHVTGFDKAEKPLLAASENFKGKSKMIHADYITSDDVDHDVCIANYPFSLKPDDEQKEYILNHDFLSQFYKGKVTGVLDFIFILKSFLSVKEGFYLCFAGIGYRSQEEKFRKYLIDNHFIKEIGMLHNCKFEHTAISILYLHLSKEKCENPIAFTLDFKSGELLTEKANFENYRFNFPQKEIAKEVINQVEIEKQSREQIEKNFTAQYEFSKTVWDFDEEIRKSGLSNPKQWLESFFNKLLAI